VETGALGYFRKRDQEQVIILEPESLTACLKALASVFLPIPVLKSMQSQTKNQQRSARTSLAWGNPNPKLL